MAPAARKSRSSDRGIILLEVLVALTLFAVGVVAVLGSLRTSQRVIVRSENLLHASWVLQEVLGERAMHPDMNDSGTNGVFEWTVEGLGMFSSGPRIT